MAWQLEKQLVKMFFSDFSWYPRFGGSVENRVIVNEQSFFIWQLFILLS